MKLLKEMTLMNFNLNSTENLQIISLHSLLTFHRSATWSSERNSRLKAEAVSGDLSVNAQVLVFNMTGERGGGL